MITEDVEKLWVRSWLLKRQIRKHLKGFNWINSEKLWDFIKSIDLEYFDSKEDRELLERSLDLSSKELSLKNEKLADILEKNISIKEKLEESKSHLRTIIDNLWEWLIVIDSDLNIIVANLKASFLSNYSVKSIVWEKYDNNIKFINNNIKSDFILDTLEKWEEYSFNRNITLVWNNREIPIFVTSTPLKNYWSDWKTACAVVFRDATKEIELSNMKNEFLSVASHELRTPMTVIKWYVSLLIKWKLWEVTDKQKTYLEKIQWNTKNLIDMVNDMLDINKLEAWKMEFNLSDFNLKELVEETTMEMQDLFSKKDLWLSCEATNISINSDNKKIKQVLINFLSNAYKFTDEGWKVKTKLLVEKDKLYVSVIDSWRWIQKENIDKLFKKFSQVWSHLNKTEKWTWLWLSLSKKIIEWLWWEVWVKSIFWEWSEFYFTLPLKKEEN